MFCFMDTFDNPLDVRGNFCHVNVYMGGCHSQVGGISSLLYHLGYMNQAFAWDAASVQTVTSQAFLIDQQDTSTKRGCNSCSSQPTRSTPNDSYVVVHTSHRTSPFLISFRRGNHGISEAICLYALCCRLRHSFGLLELD